MSQSPRARPSARRERRRATGRGEAAAAMIAASDEPAPIGCGPQGMIDQSRGPTGPRSTRPAPTRRTPGWRRPSRGHAAAAGRLTAVVWTRATLRRRRHLGLPRTTGRDLHGRHDVLGAKLATSPPTTPAASTGAAPSAKPRSSGVRDPHAALSPQSAEPGDRKAGLHRHHRARGPRRAAEPAADGHARSKARPPTLGPCRSTRVVHQRGLRSAATTGTSTATARSTAPRTGRATRVHLRRAGLIPRRSRRRISAAARATRAPRSRSRARPRSPPCRS